MYLERLEAALEKITPCQNWSFRWDVLVVVVRGLNGVVMFGVKNSKQTGPLNVAKEFELCINRIENHDLTDLPLIGI